MRTIDAIIDAMPGVNLKRMSAWWPFESFDQQ
jgi:hypothetical protein